MISQTEEYALRAILSMARRPLKMHTISSLARDSGIPEGYLSKIMQTMRKGRLISSRRGKSGGFLLNHRPEDISLADVVGFFPSGRDRMNCPFLEQGKCSKEHDPDSLTADTGTSYPCGLNRLLKDLYREFQGRLEDRKVSDLLMDKV